MILASSGLSVSKHGFVFTSIRLNLNSSSSMKSYPNISNEFINLYGSNLKQVALIVSTINLFICGTRCLRTSMSSSGWYWFR